ncbi:hypothetical protein EXU48_20740 [Occultella glacieicola]|uniref:Uncharacterized protein n=1 Tax=Occultella glacieicola TaxID=2518684 RepID=A0ABY2DZS7_9MICO|nr:hypothetical protein [Occultella glacieicola]TDE89588.1 hypothetical protein EXU48_20740 [Occultella glacieicola]
MRKASPNDVVAGFTTATAGALTDWETIDAALAAQSLSLRRRAASDAFLSLAVSWESFLSRWLVAAVNKDASRAVSQLATRLQEHAEEELRVPRSHLAATLITQSHFSLNLVRQLLDPNENNIVIREHGDLDQFARRWLADPYRTALTGISSFQFKPVLATRLIRNALAHQSESALKRANDELRKSTVPVGLRVTGARRLSVDGWRRYLLSISSYRPRIAVLHDELATVASLLVVP